MKILIVGGAGYIGSKLVSALASEKHEIKVFDKPLSITKYGDVKKAFKDFKPDIVYHLAALAELSYTDEHPEETFQVNIGGTNLIARECASRDVLLNFISTCCIYGEPLEYPSREDGLVNPTDTYAMSKAAGEYIVKMWGLSKGLRYNILRIGTVYGPSTKKEMRGDMCIQTFLRNIMKGEPITIKGDGKQNRNFIHIDDLINALTAVTEKGIEGETINIAGKERISIEDVATYAIQLGQPEGQSWYKVDWKVNYLPERKDDFRNQNIYLGKAKKLLNWQPEIKFEQGIFEFFDWL